MAGRPDVRVQHLGQGQGEIVPRQSVWFVKTSLIYLAFGFTFGGLMLANKGVFISPFLFTLLPAHMEFLLMGWLVQLAMGVVFWIAPRFSGMNPRGNVPLIIAAFWLLNLGIGLVSLQPYLLVDWLTLAGRSMEVTAVICFGFGTWKRIKPHGR
jgi:cbb3-type cytochrome oxidase subunit 1